MRLSHVEVVCGRSTCIGGNFWLIIGWVIGAALLAYFAGPFAFAQPNADETAKSAVESEATPKPETPPKKGKAKSAKAKKGKAKPGAKTAAKGAGAKGKAGMPGDGAPKPTDPPQPANPDYLIDVPDFDEAPWSRFDGQTPLPSFLTSPTPVISQGTGLTDGAVVRTVASDLRDRDFVVDVEFQFSKDEQTILEVGIGSEPEAIKSRVHGPGYGGYATFSIPGKGEVELGRFVTAGPHVLRLAKSNDSFTMAVGTVTDGEFQVVGFRTIDDFQASTPYLGRPRASVFARASGGLVTAMRAVLDGESAANEEKSPSKTTEVPSYSQAAMSRLGGNPPLPLFLRESDSLVLDATGMRAGVARSVLADLVNKDFVLDLRFRFAAGEQSVFHVGIGGARPGGLGWEEAVYSRVHGPGYGGYATISSQNHDEKQLGKFVTEGPHVFRLEKRGDVLVMAIGDVADKQFRPYFSKSILNLKGTAPYLTRENSSVFFQSGGAIIDGVRLLVDGKPDSTKFARAKPLRPSPADTAASKPSMQPPMPGRPSVPVRPTPTTPPRTAGNSPTNESSPQTKSSLVAVAGAAGRENLIPLVKGQMPLFLQPNRELVFSPERGVAFGKQCLRTLRTDLLERDFTWDVIFRFKENEQAILVVGLGPGHVDHNGMVLHECVCSRVHGPGYGGYGTVTISGQQERPLGEFKTAGPHLFRIQKRGDVLTMAIDADIRDKFVADLEQTIPSLNAVAPYLNDSKSWLFMGGGGVVEATRLAVAGEPIESRDLEWKIPRRVVAGRKLEMKLAPMTAHEFALGQGPEGLRISTTGQVAWTPTAAQLGIHPLNVGLKSSNQSIVVPGKIEVVSAEDARKVGDQLDKIDSLYSIPLLTEKSQVVPGLDGQSLLLLDGKRLLRLVGDGVTVADRYELPVECERIGERADYFVALSDARKALLLVDKKTMQVKRTIAMDYFRRHDLALHPKKPWTYVSVSASKGENLVDVFMIVDEQTGEVQEPEGLAGTWLLANREGTMLFVGEKQFLFNSSFDSLVTYDLRQVMRPYLRNIKQEPGGNGRGIVASTDGKRLTYLSFTGYPMHSKNIAAWDTSDLEKRPVIYPCKENGASCFWIAFHPTKLIAATPLEQGGAMCFDRETGVPLRDMVDWSYPPLVDVTTDRLFFSPDGQHLLLECQGEQGRFLRRVALRKSPLTPPK
ncbi:MAG: hypothetical protein U1A77_01240 [Pirellulales bacterium]